MAEVKPAEMQRLLDPREWNAQRDAMEGLCKKRPELFSDKDSAGQAGAQSPAVADDMFELHMSLSQMVEWHERRLKLLRAAAIRLYVDRRRTAAA